MMSDAVRMEAGEHRQMGQELELRLEVGLGVCFLRWLGRCSGNHA